MKKNKRKFKQIEKDSVDYFSDIYARIGLIGLLSNFVKWAENNRKKMFYIIIIFLLSVVIFTIKSPFRPKENLLLKNTSKEVALKKIKNFITEKKEILSLNELEFMMKIRDEIEKLSNKKELNKEDSIKINKLYEQLKQTQNGKN